MSSLQERIEAAVFTMLFTAVGAMICLFASMASAAASDVNGLSAGVQWTASTGPVAGYEVWVARNGAASAYQQDVPSLQAPISGADNDVLVVAVRAFSTGKAVLGPFSPNSLPITFHTPITTPTAPAIFIVCPFGTKAALSTATGTAGQVLCQ